MKILITLFTPFMVVGCAGEDNISAMARPGSAAVFHTESEAKPLPRQGGDRYASWLLEFAGVLVRLDDVARSSYARITASCQPLKVGVGDCRLDAIS